MILLLSLVIIEAVTFSSSPSDSNYSISVGDTFSLTCSATIYIDDMPSDAGAPTFG